VISKALLPESFTIVFTKIRANTYQLKTSQTVQLRRDQAFAFFQDPRNLSEITPDWLHFRMLDYDAGAEVFEGAEYDYSMKWLPWLWRTRWRSRIIRYGPPETFTDTQLKGPYRSWEHLHLFEEIPKGTRMEDIVTYRLPFGLIGELVHRAIIRAQLEDIFSYRAIRISEWASGNFIRKLN
jgi:ligand-binding SRPBCC domain-containing protein